MSNPIVIICLGCICLMGWWVFVLRRKNQYLAYMSAIKDQEREAVLTFLNRMGEAFTREINLDETLSMIGEFIIEETDAESGAIYLFDRDGQYLSARVVVGLFPPMHQTLSFVTVKKKYLQDKVKSEKIALGENIIGKSAESGAAYLIANAQDDERVPNAAHAVVPMKSMMVTPLKVRDKVLGVMAVLNKALGDSFTEDDMRRLQALADQAAVTVNIVALYGEIAEKQRIQQEIALAQDFQRLLLPDHDPIVEGYDFSGISTPALEVGGDYYDYIHIDDDHLGFCVADVAGKGIPGGLVMAAARSTLKAEARVTRAPRDVLMALNERVLTDTGANVFITMTYGIINLRTGEVTFARAGHEPTLILREDPGAPIDKLMPDGIALGLVDSEIFQVTTEESFTLKEGEMVLLYTDGVIEAMNPESAEYGMERFEEVMKANCLRSCSQMIHAIIDDISAFSEGIQQHDDITILAVKRLRDGAAKEAAMAAEAEAEAAIDAETNGSGPTLAGEPLEPALAETKTGETSGGG